MADTAAVKVHTSAAAMSTPIGVELHPCFLAPPLFLLKVFGFFTPPLLGVDSTPVGVESTPIGVELPPCFLAPPLFLLKVFFFFFLHPC